MAKQMNNSANPPRDIWIISKRKNIESLLAGIGGDFRGKPVAEYRISQLAWYLLNPYQIEIKKRLLGCKISFKKSRACRIKDKYKLSKIFPKRLREMIISNDIHHEIVLSDGEYDLPEVNDNSLASHIKKVATILSRHNVVINRLSALDINDISDIAGICDDYGGNRSLLNLQGKLDEKIKYIYNFILKDVGVILARAYLGKGLFEMRGFDFQSYKPEKYYRLIEVSGSPSGRYCVLGSNNNIEYWVDDNSHVKMLHLLEQSVRTDHKFRESLGECISGKYKPLKIFFNKQIEIDYSKENIPYAYKNIFNSHEIKLGEREKITDSLKHLQFGIAFNSVSVADPGNRKLCTNISVMHNIKALDQIKDDLPWLYSKIEEKVSFSEAGRFYLLDSIRGFQNG
jgi:hypothetical protein